MTALESQLFNALNQALEWNWMEADPPPDSAVNQIEAAILAYITQEKQEREHVNY